MTEKLVVSSSPHINTADTTRGIMLDVLISLAPASAFGIVLFGWRAALIIAGCVAGCVLFEALSCKIFGNDNTIGDLSAAVTGLLLALNLPSGIPVWMALFGCLVAIVVAKQMFGGLGHNFVNPAIAARIVLFISFPVFMTKFPEPFQVSAVTSATPLSDTAVEGAMYSLKELVFGTHGGTIGETSVICLGIGALYLILRGVINPIIPVSFIGSVALITLAFGGNPLYAICSGGLVLGACFMATDYVTSPATNLGKLIFGIGCGIVTFIIRSGAAAEGVSFAILFMNLMVPHIDSITRRKPFGWEAQKK